MEIFDGETVAVPMVRIVFEDLREFAKFQSLAAHLGMGKEWPIAMLQDYLSSYEDCAAVSDRVVTLPLVSRDCAGFAS